MKSIALWRWIQGFRDITVQVMVSFAAFHILADGPIFADEKKAGAACELALKNFVLDLMAQLDFAPTGHALMKVPNREMANTILSRLWSAYSTIKRVQLRPKSPERLERILFALAKASHLHKSVYLIDGVAPETVSADDLEKWERAWLNGYNRLNHLSSSNQKFSYAIFIFRDVAFPAFSEAAPDYFQKRDGIPSLIP